jgi:hypothetical protein
MNLNDLTDPRSFHQYMLTVNARLQGEYVPIPARPFRAWQLLQENIGARLMWLRGPEAERIAHWFTSQCGTRAGHGVWHRRLLAQLGGDPWVLNVPMVYGRVRLDLLQMIEHGSAALLRRITQEELGCLDSILPQAMNAFNALNHTEPELYSDWLGTVEHATNGFPNFGMSRWSSQQAFEKIVKEFIKRRGSQPEYSHNLEAIVALAEQLGLPTVDRLLLEKVKCRPAARYPGTSHSRESTALMAIEAHQASIVLSGRVVGEWQQPHWKIQGCSPMSSIT